MLFLRAGEHKDIVKVDYTEDVNVATERTVDISLEASGGISQTKGYNEIFVVPVVCTEGCLPLVSFPYSYPVVRVTQVDFRENHRAIQPVKQLAYKGERVAVLYRKRVKASVVDAET